MNISEAQLAIEAAILADDSPILQGVHGIGKTAIVKQVAANHGYHIEDLYLSQNEVADVIGIPRTTEHNGALVTTWTRPIWLQRMYDAAAQGKRSILFLDELNRAPIDVRQSALQLVLEKQIHEHHLPTVDGLPSIVIAAINPADQYQVDELDPALLDRFLLLDVEPDAPAWLSWARSSGIHHIICSFISENPAKLHFTPEDGTIGATPRSWAKVSAYLDHFDTIPAEVHYSILKGKLGSAIASQFLQYFQNFADAVSIKDIEKLAKDSADYPSLVQSISDLIKPLEPIQQSDLLELLCTKYISKPAKCLPYIAFVTALPQEQQAAHVQYLKTIDKLADFNTIDLKHNPEARILTSLMKVGGYLK